MNEIVFCLEVLKKCISAKMPQSIITYFLTIGADYCIHQNFKVFANLPPIHGLCSAVQSCILILKCFKCKNCKLGNGGITVGLADLGKCFCRSDRNYVLI